jgi:hypothetical protein
VDLRSVDPALRQEGQRCHADAVLDQLARVIMVRLAIDRPAGRVAVMDRAGLGGEVQADIFGVFLDLTAQGVDRTGGAAGAAAGAGAAPATGGWVSGDLASASWRSVRTVGAMSDLTTRGDPQNAQLTWPATARLSKAAADWNQLSKL